MIKALGGSAQAVVDAGGANEATVYCIYYNPGETIDMASSQIIVSNPAILVDLDDVFVSSSWIVSSGDPGTAVTANSANYTVTNRLKDDAGFVLLELTEA